MKLTAFSEADFTSIYDFMYPLWHETYGKILPKEQIDFLVNKYFSPEGVANFRGLGYQYYKLEAEKTVGMVVTVEKNDSIYLDKLYLIPESRGMGYATFVFSSLLDMGKDITLNVNQKNERAIACYKKNGFIIESEERIPLGNGMINIDYNMRLTKESFIS